MYDIQKLSHTKEKRDFMRIEILIREIRKEKNVSLDKLAKLTGMSKGHLSRIERKEKEPTITSLAKQHVDIIELYKSLKNYMKMKKLKKIFRHYMTIMTRFNAIFNATPIKSYKNLQKNIKILLYIYCKIR